MNLLFLCVALIFAEKFHFHPHLVGYGQRFPRLDDMLNFVSFLDLFSYHFSSIHLVIRSMKVNTQKVIFTIFQFQSKSYSILFLNKKNLAELGLLYLFSDQIYDQ